LKTSTSFLSGKSRARKAGCNSRCSELNHDGNDNAKKHWLRRLARRFGLLKIRLHAQS
jgi:hypothetical protein